MLTSENTKSENIDQNLEIPTVNNVGRNNLKTREIILRSDIKRSHSVVIITGGTCIISADSRSDYNPKRDFNHGILKNLRNTKVIIFSILDRDTGEFQELEIPTSLSEKIGEYLRNMQEIESNEQYRLPNGFKDYPVNCQSFVYYIKGWFENKPNLNYFYLKNEEDGNDICSGEVLYIHEGDEGTGEYWHYMIYLGDGYCISKNGHSHLVITRHYFKGLYRVIEK